jgi:hypothetical protein
VPIIIGNFLSQSGLDGGPGGGVGGGAVPNGFEVDGAADEAVDDEREHGTEGMAVGAGDGVPSDVLVAFLEALGGSAPAEDGDEFGTVRLGVSAVDSPLKDVSDGASDLEVVALVRALPAASANLTRRRAALHWSASLPSQIRSKAPP